MSYPEAGYGGYPQSQDPLHAPLYGATIGQAFGRFWKKYATFRGRASLSEFWWWALIAILASAVFRVIDIAASGGLTQSTRTSGSVGDILSYLWGLATIIPGLALSIRRLHDSDRSGFWILIGLIPLVGAIILLVFYLSGANPRGARFD